MIKDPEPVYHFIREKLGISREAKISRPYSIKVGEREMMVDLAIESEDTIALIEIRSRINEDTIYRIYVLSHLIDEKSTGKEKIRLVCAGKSLKFSTDELATRLGIEIILFPSKLYPFLSQLITEPKSNSPSEHLRASPSRLASEKAWKTVCSLITSNSYSILEVSRKSGVSYGWTNTIIHKLEGSGIVAADYSLRIKDIDKLFNLVSWERPLESLLVETINTSFNSATQCINEVSLNLNKLGIDYAFTSHSSAVSYGSSIVREDTAYIYLPNPSDREVLRLFTEKNMGGCRLNIYVPDRNIMSSSTKINGIRIVDICQNILDLAGLGMDGRIAAKDLVRKFGK